MTDQRAATDSSPPTPETPGSTDASVVGFEPDYNIFDYDRFPLLVWLSAALWGFGLLFVVFAGIYTLAQISSILEASNPLAEMTTLWPALAVAVFGLLVTAGAELLGVAFVIEANTRHACAAARLLRDSLLRD